MKELEIQKDEDDIIRCFNQFELYKFYYCPFNLNFKYLDEASMMHIYWEDLSEGYEYRNFNMTIY